MLILVKSGQWWEHVVRVGSGGLQDLFSDSSPCPLTCGDGAASSLPGEEDTGHVSHEGFMRCFKREGGAGRRIRGTLSPAIFSDPFRPRVQEAMVPYSGGVFPEPHQ